jgi:peroxiredoxin
MTSLAEGGKYNKKIAIGNAAPTFNSLPGIDDKNHSLAEYSNKDVLVLCITCNYCVVAVQYESKIIAFNKKYTTAPASKVAFVAINVSNNEADKLPKMKERAKEQGFNFPYLYDASQVIGRSLGASATPEFWVFNKDRKLVYTGAMDDSTGKTNYVEAAVEATLKGLPVAVPETRVRGCAVEYDR